MGMLSFLMLESDFTVVFYCAAKRSWISQTFMGAALWGCLRSRHRAAPGAGLIRSVGAEKNSGRTTSARPSTNI